MVKTTHKGKKYVTGIVEYQRKRKMNKYDLNMSHFFRNYESPKILGEGHFWRLGDVKKWDETPLPHSAKIEKKNFPGNFLSLCKGKWPYSQNIFNLNFWELSNVIHGKYQGLWILSILGFLMFLPWDVSFGTIKKFVCMP